MEKHFNKEQTDAIEWTMPRVLCIAGDFTKFDVHAVAQINRSIGLIRYRRYGDALLFQLVNSPVEQASGGASGNTVLETVAESLAGAPAALKDRFETLKIYLNELGDDVQMRTLQTYFAFQRIRNFACVEVRPMSASIVVFAKVDPTSITLDPGFTRDMRKKGHYGTGDLEITLCNEADLDRAKPLLLRSYEAS